MKKEEQIINATNEFSARGCEIIERAFDQASPRVAENYGKIGREIQPRTVRTFYEKRDVNRYDIVQNIVQLLGVTMLTDPWRCEIVWQSLEAYMRQIRAGLPVPPTIDVAMADFNVAAAQLQSVFLRGNLANAPAHLLTVDDRLRALWTRAMVLTN